MVTPAKSIDSLTAATSAPARRPAHTPGPWRVGERRGQATGIDAPCGEPRLVMAKWRQMVEVYGCDDDPVIGGDVMEANARLIAAAPDLLDALRAFCGDHEATGMACEGLNAAYWHAKSVIARVDGDVR